MKTIVFFVVLTSALFTSSAYSQPAELVSYKIPGRIAPRIVINNAIQVVQGTTEDIINFRTVKVFFDYSEMTVCKYNNMTAYLYHKTRHQSPEKAAEYRERWAEKTKTIFESRFRDYFNKKVEKVGIVSYSGSDTAAVQLFVKFKSLEPHCHQGQNNNVPFVHVYCQFVGNEGYQYVTYELTAFASRDNNDADRVAECYAVAGKMLGSKLASYAIKRERHTDTETKGADDQNKN